MFLLDQFHVSYGNLFFLVSTKSITFLLVLPFLLGLLQQFMPLLSLFPFKFLNLMLFIDIFLYFKLLPQFLFFLFGMLKVTLFLYLCFLFQKFYVFVFLSRQFLFLLQLQIIFIYFQMIHNFNIFHSKYFGPFFDYSCGLSSTSIVYLDEILMIPIKPFPFPSVNLYYPGIYAVNLFPQPFYLHALILLYHSLTLSSLLLVLFNLFDLIVHLRRLIEHTLVDKQIDILLDGLFHF